MLVAGLSLYGLLILASKPQARREQLQLAQAVETVLPLVPVLLLLSIAPPPSLPPACPTDLSFPHTSRCGIDQMDPMLQNWLRKKVGVPLNASSEEFKVSRDVFQKHVYAAFLPGPHNTNITGA